VTATAAILAAVERHLLAAHPDRGLRANARWVWVRGPVRASLEVYDSGTLGFWCRHDPGVEVRLLAQDLSVEQVLGALRLATSDPATTDPPEAAGGGITLTLDQLTAWAGRPLTPEDVEFLDGILPDSALPQVIATIVATFPTDPGDQR
jgi:hypothetical protein